MQDQKSLKSVWYKNGLYRKCWCLSESVKEHWIMRWNNETTSWKQGESGDDWLGKWGCRKVVRSKIICNFYSGGSLDGHQVVDGVYLYLPSADGVNSYAMNFFFFLWRLLNGLILNFNIVKVLLFTVFNDYYNTLLLLCCYYFFDLNDILSLFAESRYCDIVNRSADCSDCLRHRLIYA